MPKSDWIFNERWIFDQSQNSGVDFTDPAQVAGYDVKNYGDADIASALLDKLGVSKEHTLIDLGAGTGTFALQAANRCKRVIAVDISATMLGYIERQAHARGLNNIECVNAGFLTYDHHGTPVDFIVTKNALHHIPDFWKVQALVRLSNWLKQGGSFSLQDLVFSFDPRESTSYIDAWLSAAPTDPTKGWARAELAAHVREEFSTYSWILEAMLERAGLKIREANYSESKIFAHYICIKT